MSSQNASFIKFADDTTVIGLIFGGLETAYRREVADLVAWFVTIIFTLMQTRPKTWLLTHEA